MKSGDNNANTNIDRRSFLSHVAMGSGIAVGSLVYADHLSAAPVAEGLSTTLANLQQFSPESEDYWLAVKKMFALKPGLIALNAANLCPASRSVTEKLFERTHDIDSDPSFENRLKYEKTKEHTRHLLATMLGASPDEIALTRNTSESNHTVISGLDLAKGDEVILWDQNHESNNIAWDVWRKRLGFTIKRVTTPQSPKNSTELLKLFTEAIGPKTKLVSFSHVSNISGMALPAKALCKTITAQGALSLVDGAQTFGMSVQDLQDMGCDFYTGSAHKWLCGPRETGVLFVRRSTQEILWPPMVTHDWEKDRDRGARKFDNLGQRDDGRLEALGTAVGFHNMIGGKRIEARIRSHVTRLMDGLKPISDQITYLTPSNPGLRAGIVIFMISGIKAMPAMKIMYQDYGISMAAADSGDQTWIRFAPHIYNSTDDIDTAVKAVKHILSV